MVGGPVCRSLRLSLGMSFRWACSCPDFLRCRPGLRLSVLCFQVVLGPGGRFAEDFEVVTFQMPLGGDAAVSVD